MKKAKENNLHTAIETCGFTDKNKIKQIAEFTDLFLFDFKESNPKLHKTYTGVDNILILENLRIHDDCCENKIDSRLSQLNYIVTETYKRRKIGETQTVNNSLINKMPQNGGHF